MKAQKVKTRTTNVVKAVKPGADINENGRSVILRTTNPFLIVTQKLCTRSRHAGPAQHSQQISSSVQKILNHSQVFLNETNIFLKFYWNDFSDSLDSAEE